MSEAEKKRAEKRAREISEKIARDFKFFEVKSPAGSKHKSRRAKRADRYS